MVHCPVILLLMTSLACIYYLPRICHRSISIGQCVGDNSSKEVLSPQVCQVDNHDCLPYPLAHTVIHLTHRKHCAYSVPTIGLVIYYFPVHLLAFV